jgi:predicted PurR-regulated permease PerM
MNTSAEHESELQKTIEYIRKLLIEGRDYFLVLCLLLGIYFLFNLAPQMFRLLLLSYGISMLLRPLVISVRRAGYKYFRIPPGVIAVAGCVTIITVVVSLFLWIFPPLISNIASTLSTLNVSLPERLVTQLEKVSLLVGFDLPKREELLALLVSYGKKHLNQENLSAVFSGLLQTIFAGYSFGLTVLNLLLVPIFVFYLSQDWHRFNRSALRSIPLKFRATVHDLALTVDETIIRYSKAQFLVASILMVLYSIALLIAQVPNAVPIGILSGIISVIPYAGLVVGLCTSILMNLSVDPAGASILAPVIAFVCVQALEGNVITPKIMSESTGLHPGVVLFSLLVGGSAFGLLGVVFAVPVVATVRNIIVCRKVEA